MRDGEEEHGVQLMNQKNEGWWTTREAALHSQKRWRLSLSQFLNTLWQNVREEFENEILSEEYDLYVSQIFQC